MARQSSTTRQDQDNDETKDRDQQRVVGPEVPVEVPKSSSQERKSAETVKFVL